MELSTHHCMTICNTQKTYIPDLQQSNMQKQHVSHNEVGACCQMNQQVSQQVCHGGQQMACNYA